MVNVNEEYRVSRVPQNYLTGEHTASYSSELSLFSSVLSESGSVYTKRPYCRCCSCLELLFDSFYLNNIFNLDVILLEHSNTVPVECNY